MYTLLQVQRVLQKKELICERKNNSCYKNPEFIKDVIEIVISPIISSIKMKTN
jgi:hypothetical protein